MKPTAPLRLCGVASQELGKRLKECKSELARFSLLFDYWTSLPGLSELWELLDAISAYPAALCSPSLSLNSLPACVCAQ